VAGPNLSVSDASVVEAGSGGNTLLFTVSIPDVSSQAVGFDFTASGVSATAGSDFTGGTQAGLSIPVGYTAIQVSVPVIGDDAVEGDELLAVHLGNVTGGTPLDVDGVGRILNDDGTVLASSSAYAVNTSPQLDSNGAAMSQDGRFIAFQSKSEDLVPCSPSPCAAWSKGDVYLRDLVLGTTQLVSQSPEGGRGNQMSRAAAVSPDGRYVAFESWATNLVTGDDDTFRSDIFLRDAVLGTTMKVSVTPDGGYANGESFEAAVSSDGRYVAFMSSATNLVPNYHHVADIV
jgi:hypothetical protein